MGTEKTVNKVIFIGRLGGAPKLHHLRQKRPFCTFDIATQGVRASDTAWHSIVVYGKLAEKCHQELYKGALVYIEGALEGRFWEDRSRRKHKSYAVYPKLVQLLEAATRSYSSFNTKESAAQEDSKTTFDMKHEV